MSSKPCTQTRGYEPCNRLVTCTQQARAPRGRRGGRERSEGAACAALFGHLMVKYIIPQVPMVLDLTNAFKFDPTEVLGRSQGPTVGRMRLLAV